MYTYRTRTATRLQARTKHPLHVVVYKHTKHAARTRAVLFGVPVMQ